MTRRAQRQKITLSIVKKPRMVIRRCIRNKVNYTDMVRTIIGLDSGVKPTKDQCKELLKFGSNKLTVTEWFLNLGKEVCSNRNLKELNDLDIRTREIINQMIIDNKNHLITMDGHGRTLYYILKHIFDARSKGKMNYSITLEFREIDDNVHLWHELFFPISNNNINIVLTKKDIFSDWYTALSESIAIPSNQVIYLNFCGLGPCKEKVENLVWLSRLNKMFNLFVSLSFISINTKLKLEMTELFSNFKSLTDRKTFRTYHL